MTDPQPSSSTSCTDFLDSPLALPLIMALAFLLRILHWAKVRSGPFIAQLAMDSLEYDTWALSIVEGDWLGQGAFFQAPFYPYLLAVGYRLVGLTHRLDAVYLLQIGVATLAVLAVYKAGALLGGRRLGATAAMLLALSGPVIFADVQLLKESLATSLAGFFLWALLAARKSPQPRLWVLGGLALGGLVLLRENALALLPLFALWAFATGDKVRVRLARASYLLLGTVLCLLPFLARNWLVTGEALLTTYQGGVNFYIGNNAHADGTYRPLTPGRQIPRFERQEPIRLAEQALGRTLKPGEVSRYWWSRALSWAWEDKVAFLELQLGKLRLFWTFYEWPDAVDYAWMRGRSPALRLAFVEFGALCLLAAPALWHLRREWHRWLPVLLFATAWTAITVIFFVFSRYRLPIFPALALLAGLSLEKALHVILCKGGNWRRILAFLLVGASLLLPRALAREPRMDLMHYNLGLLAQKNGNLAEARHHYEQAAALDPSSFSSRMNLGTLAARSGNLREAINWFREASEIQPLSPEVWANLGAGHLACQEPETAETVLLRALTLDPTNLAAAHNLALTYERLGNLSEASHWNHVVLEAQPDHEAAGRLRDRLQEPEPAGS